MANQNRLAIGITIACSLIAASLFLIPAWIIQPFRAQAQDQLALALAVRRLAPVATLMLVAAVVACVMYFRPRRRAAVICGIAVVVTALAAVAVRVNYFELMFHANPAPQFVAAADAHVDRDDMVMVARIGSTAHAYPVRIMAYHHLVNDTIDGVPIVPTY